jgi:hypothetical protein
MLNTIDTVIAFAVIMTVLSLLITIIVQMVSAGLSLRGKNLANALSLTFQTIDPNIGKHAHSLAAQILRDPIFSDSFSRKKARPSLDEMAQKFIAAERKLRDAKKRKPDDPNREWAISEAATEVETARAGLKIPEVKPNREKPWGFWTWPWGGAMQIASAIRPGEIYRILHEFREMSPDEAQLRDIPRELVDKAAALIAVLQRWDQPAIESRGKLADIATLSKIFQPEQQKAVVDALSNFGATVERATTQAYDRFQRWFGSAQDRAEQWFQMHMRIVTIVFAIVIAFFLQLDTIDMFRQLRSRPHVVEALTRAAGSVLEQGQEVLNPANTPAADAEFFEKEKERGRRLQETLASADFDLVPAPFFGRWDNANRKPDLYTRFAQFGPHLFGVLVTAGLLTLGAPFWFNLLKNLMNLRPALATLIEKRPTSAPALPPAPATPPSPS